MARLSDLLAAAPHKNDLREQWVYDEFERRNAFPIRFPVERFLGKPLKENNIVVLIEGSDELSPIYLTAHHDHEGSGNGIVDNWSGVVALIELHGRFSTRRLRRPLVLVSFALEETRTMGSSYFVRQLGDSPVHANVNLECLGPGPLHYVAYGDADDLAPREIPQAPYENVLSDARSFHEIGGHRAIGFDGIAAVKEPMIHTKRDTIDAIDMDHYARSLDQIEAYLRSLDSQKLHDGVITSRAPTVPCSPNVHLRPEHYVFEIDRDSQLGKIGRSVQEGGGAHGAST